MKSIKNQQSRRAFLKTSAYGTGGLMLSFSWLSAQVSPGVSEKEILPVQAELTGYIIIKEDNTVIIFSQRIYF